MTGESKETEPQEGINISRPVLGHISACDVLTSNNILVYFMFYTLDYDPIPSEYISCFTLSVMIPTILNI